MKNFLTTFFSIFGKYIYVETKQNPNYLKDAKIKKFTFK